MMVMIGNEVNSVVYKLDYIDTLALIKMDKHD